MDEDRRKDDPDRWLWTYTIPTTGAPDALDHVHDRALVLIPPELRDDWLSPQLDDLAQVRDMLTAVLQSPLHPYEVGTKVNKPGNNGPELITPV